MKEQIKLVPKRRFKEFQNTHAWEQKKLEDLAQVRTGKAFSSTEFNDAGEYLVVTNKNIQDQENGVTSVGDRIDISDENMLKNYLLSGENILVTMDGVNIGKTGKYSNEKAVLAQRVGRLNSEQFEFVYQITKNNRFETEMHKLSVGNAIKHISLKQISEYSFLAPVSEEEQEKIGVFFKQLDETIVLQKRQLEKMKALKSAYLSEMFPTEGKCEPKKRFRGFTQAWETCKLGEVVENLYNGQTPSRFNDGFWNGNINWLSSGELNRAIIYKTSEKITPLGQKDANLRIVPKGTFIMAITGLEAAGTRGNCGILGVDTTINQSCMAIYPKKEKLDTQFLFQWYKMVGDDYGTRFTQGTKQQSYNAEVIKNLEITLPTIEEQKAIGGFLSSLDNLIILHHHKLKKLQNVKKAYLNELFV